MDVLGLLQYINDASAIPSTILFFSVALILTVKTGFMQFRAIPRFFKLVRKDIHDQGDGDDATVTSFQALFTAMASTIGMGNVVGPSLAVYSGGPGALFWLVVYIFFGSVTKLTEVVLALHTRERLEDGSIVGGPMQYLKKVHPFLAYWYMSVMIFLFMGWSGLQSNTLGQIFELEGVPKWVIGISLAVMVYLVLRGGIQRIGMVTSKLVPIMFFLYVSFALFILLNDTEALINAFRLISENIFSPTAPVGAFMGVSVMKAMQLGIYRSIYITEAGLGVSSIGHSMSDTNRPLDQGILAMVSMLADAILSMLSGLLVLVTGVWLAGDFRSTLVYEVFKLNSPFIGRIILVISISLFVITTVIGNTFNGTQAFTSFARHRYVNWYLWATLFVIACGSMMTPRVVWELMDIMLTCVAIPNVIGVLILAFRNPQYFKLRNVK